MAKTLKPINRLLKKYSVFLLFTLGSLLVFSPLGSAALLGNRSMQVTTALVSTASNHKFDFTIITSGTLGSIAFEYCSNSPLFDVACTAPSGIDVSSASLATQSGNTGFTIDTVNSSSNKLVITRSASAAATVASSYTFNNVINPSTPNRAIFVRISTYSSTDGSGSFTDNGAVAYATVSPLNVNAYVPPFLSLCVGISVSVNCSSVSGSSINLGILSPNKAAFATSEFAAGTNGATGYSVFTLGTTMTSGNNIIAANSLPTDNRPGTAQFGINLRANSNPVVGADPQGSGSATPQSNYNAPNLFVYQNGDKIAGSSLPSDFNKMTASYVVNVPSSQEPGVYSTTLTYLATADF